MSAAELPLENDGFAERIQQAACFSNCDLTAHVLKHGLDVLGIETVEQM
jgi:arginyl-tRNA synthetase